MYLFAVIPTTKVQRTKDTTRPKNIKKNATKAFSLSLFIASKFNLDNYIMSTFVPNVPLLSQTPPAAIAAPALPSWNRTCATP